MTANFYFRFSAVLQIYFCDSFNSDKQSKLPWSIARFVYLSRPCHKAHKALKFVFYPLHFAATALTCSRP